MKMGKYSKYIMSEERIATLDYNIRIRNPMHAVSRVSKQFIAG